MLIDKKTLEYLAELSRIELDKKHEEKLLEDLQEILGYFEELKSVDTENVEPMSGGHAERDLSHAKRGGTIKKNVLREDELINESKTSSVQLTGQFPEKENGYLKIPPVFE